ncbi:MAG: hypothetical protein PHC98_07235, partial [Syntrophotalea acetylenica]|nr:hypothetical protein [Syntrophotalea acetylenica]
SADFAESKNVPARNRMVVAAWLDSWFQLASQLGKFTHGKDGSWLSLGVPGLMTHVPSDRRQLLSPVGPWDDELLILAIWRRT